MGPGWLLQICISNANLPGKHPEIHADHSHGAFTIEVLPSYSAQRSDSIDKIGYKSWKEYTMDTENLSTIYVAGHLQAQEQYYFTPTLLASLFNLERRRAYQLAGRLKSEGLADEVENGKYLLLGLEPERVLSNPFFIASQVVNPCYVSYWSAVHAHNLTTQTPQTVFCATTRKKTAPHVSGPDLSLCLDQAAQVLRLSARTHRRPARAHRRRSQGHRGQPRSAPLCGRPRRGGQCAAPAPCPT